MSLKLKVCGMTLADNIRQVDELKPDLMGFIFYEKSPRCCRQKPEYLPQHAKRVGVFVNADAELIGQSIYDFSLDYLQLHGTETPKDCKRLTEKFHTPIIKVFSIANNDDVMRTDAYEGLCEMFLFDTATPHKGGSGRQFDWTLLESYKGNTPFMLSGGIAPDSVQQLKSFSHPMLAGYDINSRFEDAPGIKNVALIKQFKNKLAL